MKRKDDGADLDHHLNMMLEAIERLERNRCPGSRRWRPDARPPLMPMQAELRTLELWRSVMAECLATFLYVAVVCGAATSDASPVLGAAAASGFTMLALTVCLQNVSGNVYTILYQNITYVATNSDWRKGGGGVVGGRVVAVFKTANFSFGPGNILFH